ncbi:MAG: response regulator [Verrucomicrobia bacterium]|nr:response regulator [Verrucomicrobiota bacterium]
MLTSNTKRLLVVVDDEQIHHLVKFCFSDEYDFQCAFTGEEALDLAEKEEFPVVLLDLNLPGESGMEILPKLRVKNRHQKITILTGHASRQNPF